MPANTNIRFSDGNMFTIPNVVSNSFVGFTSSRAFDSFTIQAPGPPIVTGMSFGTMTTPTKPFISTAGIVPVYGTGGIIQPGEWVTIYGDQLATVTRVWNGDFPASLGGTSVTINGKPAYLWFVSPGQINLQAPDDSTTGPVPVVVTTAAGTVTSSVILAHSAPSFDLLDSKHVAGIVVRSNGSGAYGGGTYDVLGPNGNPLGYPTTAARARDVVELYGVGFGPTFPAVPAGQPYSGSANVSGVVQVLIGGDKSPVVVVTPSFCGLSSAGLYQINLTIPDGIGSGDFPLVAAVNGIRTGTGVVISLQ